MIQRLLILYRIRTFVECDKPKEMKSAWTDIILVAIIIIVKYKYMSWFDKDLTASIALNQGLHVVEELNYVLQIALCC